jgi:hypothetical protein
MLPNDRSRQLYKIYKETTSGIGPGEQNTQQGYEHTAQDDQSGEYTDTKCGDEQGWQFWEPDNVSTEGPRQSLGTWAPAVPVFYHEGNSTFLPMKDKTLAVDADYTAKTPGSSADGDHTKVRVAEDGDSGVPGIIVPCMNHAAHEYIFFPISEFKLKVDHKSAGNSSSKIYDVKADGTVDTSNIGTTKDLWEVHSNKAYNLTTAEYSDTSSKRGKLDFDSGAFPGTITTPTTPANYRVKMAWNASTSKWEFYCIGEATETSISYAKIAWNYHPVSGDMSEGELMTYNSSTEAWTDTDTKIWIDYSKSKQVQFHTAGNNTIFIVRLLKSDESRSTDTRDLYYAVQCFRDDGNRITHLESISKHMGHQLYGYIQSTDLDPEPWIDNTTARITTNIVGTDKQNFLPVQIGPGWRVYGSTIDWAYVESADFGRGMPFYFRPILPTMFDKAAKTYNCPYKNGGNYVAKYEAL